MKFRLSLVERWTGIFLCELILSTNETRAEQGGTALETGSVAGYFVRTSLLPVGCFGQTGNRDAGCWADSTALVKATVLRACRLIWFPLICANAS